MFLSNATTYAARESLAEHDTAVNLAKSFALPIVDVGALTNICISRFKTWEHYSPSLCRNHEVVERALFKTAEYVRSDAFELARSGLLSSWNSLTLTVDASRDAVGLADVSNTMERLYHWEQDQKGRLASAYAVYFVESNFSSHNLAAINTLLLNISIARLTEWSMVAILRSSYSARESLPGWKPFLESVADALKNNNKVDRLLMGLI